MAARGRGYFALYTVLVEEGKFLEGIDLVLKPYDGDSSGGTMQMY